MFTIDLSLKNTPFPLSVQRKSEEDAEAVYQQILQAMRSNSSEILELTCDRQVEKRIAVKASEINGVQISQKASSATASGKPPGFYAFTE